MKNVLNFIVGSSTTFILLTKETISDIPPNWLEIIKLLISVFGGVLATLFMNLIKKWFQKGQEIKLIEALEKDNRIMSETLNNLNKVIKLDDFKPNNTDIPSKSQPTDNPEQEE